MCFREGMSLTECVCVRVYIRVSTRLRVGQCLNVYLALCECVHDDERVCVMFTRLCGNRWGEDDNRSSVLACTLVGKRGGMPRGARVPGSEKGEVQTGVGPSPALLAQGRGIPGSQVPSPWPSSLE